MIILLLVHALVTCLASNLPPAPSAVSIRVVEDNVLRVTVAPPVDDGGADLTFYKVVIYQRLDNTFSLHDDQTLLSCSDLLSLGWVGYGQVTLLYHFSDNTASNVTIFCEGEKTYLNLPAGGINNYAHYGCRVEASQSSGWRFEWSRVELDVHEMTINLKNTKYAKMTQTPTSSCDSGNLEINAFTTENLASSSSRLQFLRIEHCGGEWVSYTAKADLSGTSFSLPVGGNQKDSSGYLATMSVVPANLAGQVIEISARGYCLVYGAIRSTTDAQKVNLRLKDTSAKPVRVDLGTVLPMIKIDQSEIQVTDDQSVSMP